MANFRDPLLFQKRLRSEWQHQQRVSYCRYGSHQHMMMTLFERQSMPFYKFGDTMYLSKISRADWISLIVTALDETQKHISEELADKIAANVQDHSYYVQQLSHMVWINTDREVSPAIVDQVLENLLQQNAILYTRDKEDLSATQLAYMKALASGVTSGLNSRAMIERFRLGTSASVTKAKRALLDKELIEERGGNYYFLDPVYELWFRRLIRR